MQFWLSPQAKSRVHNYMYTGRLTFLYNFVTLPLILLKLCNKQQFEYIYITNSAITEWIHNANIPVKFHELMKMLSKLCDKQNFRKNGQLDGRTCLPVGTYRQIFVVILYPTNEYIAQEGKGMNIIYCHLLFSVTKTLSSRPPRRTWTSQRPFQPC